MARCCGCSGQQLVHEAIRVRLVHKDLLGKQGLLVLKDHEGCKDRQVQLVLLVHVVRVSLLVGWIRNC